MCCCSLPHLSLVDADACMVNTHMDKAIFCHTECVVMMLRIIKNTAASAMSSIRYNLLLEDLNLLSLFLLYLREADC